MESSPGQTPNSCNILLMLLYVLQVNFQLFKQNLSKTQLTPLAIHLVREWDKSRIIKKKSELSQMYSCNMQQVICIEYSSYTGSLNTKSFRKCKLICFQNSFQANFINVCGLKDTASAMLLLFFVCPMLIKGWQGRSIITYS